MDRCALRAILVAVSARGICAISLGDEASELVDELRSRFARARQVAPDKGLQHTVKQVIRLVEMPANSAGAMALPLDIRGTAFQQRVWQALQKVPAGATVTYKELAKRAGSPKAVRAVASACASNTLAVAVPCHRVVRANGDLAGYRWGVERKKELLARERP